MVQAVYSSAGFKFDISAETAFNSGTILAGFDFGAAGIGTKFTSYELDNAWNPIPEIGQRTPQAYYTAGLSAPVNVDFMMCQDQIGWLGFVLTNSSATVVGTFTPGNTIYTGQVQLGTPQGSAFTIGGIVFTQAKISVKKEAPVEVTLNGVGTSFGTATGTISGTGAVPSTLLTWKDVSLTGITTALVQELDITINTGAKQYYALGSVNYQTYLPLASDIQVDITAFYYDGGLEEIFAMVTAGTVTIAFGTHTATFTGTYLTKGTLQLQPVTEAISQFTFKAQSVSIA